MAAIPPSTSTAPATSLEDNYPSAARGWYVVGVLMLVYMFSYADRQILNLLVRPIRRDLQISDTQMSLLMGFSFAFFYAIFGIPLGRMADTRSRRTIIACGFAMWSIFTAACGMARNFLQMFLLRMGVGVGEAALSPSAYSLISDYFPLQKRGLALGVYSMGIYLGSGLAFILGGTIAGIAGQEESWMVPLVGEMRPWQLVFLIVGLPGLLLALLMYTFAEPPRKSHKVGVAGPPISEVMRYLAANWKTILCHNVGFGLLSFSSYASGAWIPTFFVRIHGWNEGSAGQKYGLTVAIFGTLGVAIGGWMVDWLSKRGFRDAAMRVGLIVGIAWAPFGITYLMVEDAYVALCFLAPAIFFASAPFGAAVAAIQQAFPGPMRGQASAVYLFILTLIGLGVGPTSVALVTDYYFDDDNMVHRSLLIVSTVAHILSAILLWVGLKPFVASLDRLKEWTGGSDLS